MGASSTPARPAMTPEIIQAVAKQLVGQIVGDGDVIKRRFDVVAQNRVVFDRPLPLVQEGDG